VHDGAQLIERERLVQRVAGAPVVVLEAPSGYGKSTFADELTKDRERIVVGLAAGDTSAGRLLARMAEAAGSDPVAADAAVSDGEPADRLTRFVEAATSSGNALIVDDVHHLDDDALQALATAVAASTHPRGQVVIIGRRVVPRPANAALLDERELAFTRDEMLAALLTQRAGVAADDVALCRRATDGWPAAVMLWGRLAMTDPAKASIEQLVAALAHELPAGGESLLRIAPLLSPSVGEVVGWPTIIEELARCGFPLRQIDGWWMVGDVARDHLASTGVIDRAHAVAIAELYAARGRFLHAVDLLLAVDAPEDLARLVGTADLELLEQIDLQELASIVLQLPRSALAAEPRCLLTLAWAASARVQISLRRRLLDRLDEFTGADERLARQVEVERVYDLSRDAQMADAERRGLAVLAQLGDDEQISRVRCLYALGETATIVGDPASLVKAAAYFGESIGLARVLGLDLARAKALNTLAYSVHFSRAEFPQALARVEEAVSLVRRGSRLYGTLLNFTAEILQYLGRDDDALDALAEARAIARRFGDVRTIAYLAWTAAKVAARRRDRGAVHQWLAEADANRAEWYDHPTGAEFLAGAAEACAMAGDTAAARQWLARAQQHPAIADYPDIAWPAEGSIEARDGDPVVAQQVLTRLLEEGWTEYRERWHYRLWIASARLRAGDRAGADAMVAVVRNECAGLGQPGFPQLHEPEMWQALTVDAATAAQPVTTVAVQLLDHFAVLVAGEAAALAPGKPQQLVKMLALNGRAMPDDEVCDLLWPDAEPDVGRRRLRNVVARVRAAGPLLARTEGMLALAPGISVDLTEFEGLAQTALRGGGAQRRERAQHALAHYRGEVLPGDRFEDWTTAPRERARNLAVRLLEVVIDEADAAGDVDDAIAAIERLVETDPYDDRSAERASAILSAHGRPTSAKAWADRADRIRAELGLR